MSGMAVLCLAALLPGQVPTASGHDAYYVVVFGAQPPLIKSPRYAHSFATFVHVCPDGRSEDLTISWLSLDGKVRPYEVHPEPGRNFGLHETLDLCAKNRMEVAIWGPFEIDPDLWARAVAQKERLDSGAMLYRPNDEGATDGRITNCLHAVSMMARQPGQRMPYVKVLPANWGESGSYWIALTLRPWFIDPCCRHPEIMALLGLRDCAFVHNDLARNPTRAPALRVTQAILQSYLLPNRVRCDGH